MIDKALREAYLATRYVVTIGVDRVELRIGRPAPELDRYLVAGSIATAAFVTAWNPRSERLSEAENLLRSQELATTVAALGLQALPVVTAADDPQWIEHGLLILDISEAQARALGDRFGQNAIVMLERGGAPRLVELVSPGAAS